MVSVGQALRQKFPKSKVYLEFNFREFVREVRDRERTGRFPDELSNLARPDILITDSKDNLRLLIEVKRNVYTISQIERDLIRCCAAINSSEAGTIDDAVILFNTRTSIGKKSSHEEKQNVLIDRIKNTLTAKNGDPAKGRLRRSLKSVDITGVIGDLGQNNHFNDKDWCWMSGAVRMSRKKGSVDSAE